MLSGLGTAGRGYFAALQASKVPVSLISTSELFTHQSGIGRVPARQRPRFPISIAHINADAVQLFLYFHGSTFANARYKIAIWAWELPSFRDEWRREIEIFDEIWVPSKFCRRAIAAMTSKPVMVIPHVVSAYDTVHRVQRQRLHIDDDEYVFLYMFDASSFIARKNPQCLVDAFQATFAPREKVRLILKASNTQAHSPFAVYLQDLVEHDPRCSVLPQLMTADEVTALLAACDCYVSPHRSEGFGLTVAEAMAHGKPVVATDFAGTTDFVTGEVGFPLDYQLTEIKQDYGPYPRGAIWADPSREHLEEILRRVVCKPRLAAEKGMRGRDLMRLRYSESAVGLLMRDRIAAIYASFPLSSPRIDGTE